MAVTDSLWVDMYAPLHAAARAQEREEATENDLPVTSESEACEACEDEEEGMRCLEVQEVNTPITSCAQVRGKFKRPHAYACTKCGATFVSSDKLRVHDRRKHTGEKPYACRMPGCGWAFVNSWDRTMHERKHSGERPHACTHCGQRFASNQQRKVHEMRMHTHEKPWECIKCGKKFTTKGQLTEHTRWHTGEKPYECAHPGCGRRFTTKGELTVHARDHLPEKPFPCRHPGCGRRYTVPYVRKKHELDLHGLVVA